MGSETSLGRLQECVPTSWGTLESPGEGLSIHAVSSQAEGPPIHRHTNLCCPQPRDMPRECLSDPPTTPSMVTRIGDYGMSALNNLIYCPRSLD